MIQALQSARLRERRISVTDTILTALKQMDQIDRKLLLVFQEEIFAGLLSAGDVQRAIIGNLPLDTLVGKVLRSNVRMARPADSQEEIRKTMIHYRTECMPVVDDDGKLLDVIFWEDLFPDEDRRIAQRLNLPVVIMAGGKGTRLKPFTNILPKPLMPINDKTILEHIMDRFLRIGCDQFFLSVNYKADIIRYYIENLGNPDYHIRFFQEEKPLGTAGSLFLLKDEIFSTFFVSNCDILVDQDYGAIYDYHKEERNELTLVAALKHVKIHYGTIETAEGGQLTGLVEKPEITYKINSGLYILEPHLLKEIPVNEFFNITDLIERIQKRKGRVGVFPVSEKSWKDIGEWSEFFRISKQFSDE